MDKIKVAVLFGGRSGEHDLSLRSGQAVLNYLDESPRYQPAPVLLCRDGVWTLPDYADDTHNAAHTTGGPVIVSAGASLVGADVVFPVLHGKYGQDGTVQGMLELANLPYVGSGVFASAAAMDKEYTKRLLSSHGFPVPRSVVMRPHDNDIDHESKIQIGLPVFITPATAGSAANATTLQAWSDFPEAIEHAREVSNKVLVEEVIEGRAVKVAVLEHPDGMAVASQPAEVHARDGHGRDDIDPADVTVPARLDGEMTDVLREAAVAVFRALGCHGLARVDFVVTKDNGLAVSDVNTMPAFTEKSVYPMVWQASGVEFGALVDTLIDAAIARHCNG